MSDDADVRCSSACTRASIAVLILCAISLSMFKPVDQTQRLDALLKYTSARLILKEELERLEGDAAWRGLMAIEAIAETARNKWNLEKLLDYTFVDVVVARSSESSAKPDDAKPETKPDVALPKSKEAPSVQRPAPPTNLQIRFTTVRRIEPLHRAAEALTELGKGDILALGRQYSPRADRSIYGWTMLRHRLNKERMRLNNPGIVVVEMAAAEQPRSFFSSRLFAVGSFVRNFTREELIKNFTLPLLNELANYESPTVAQAEALKKEQPDIALPSFGIPIGLLRSITIIELGMLFTLFYFWLYYRDARSSRQFPLRATLFGVVARTPAPGSIFFGFLLIPSATAAILAYKVLWFTYDNAPIAILVIGVAVAIRRTGPFPRLNHPAL